MDKTKVIAASVAGGILVLGSFGWFFANRSATHEAQDDIDAFILRHHLRQTVTYDSVSASVFGSVEITGITIKARDGKPITVKSLALSNIGQDGNNLKSIKAKASGVTLPIADIAMPFNTGRYVPGDDIMQALGYGQFNGNIEVGYQFDDRKGDLQLDLAFSDDNLGSFKANIGLTALPSNPATALQAIASGGGQNLLVDGLAGISVLGTVARAELKSLTSSVDNRPFTKRLKLIPAEAVPSDDQNSPDDRNGYLTLADQLVESGLSPSKAKEDAKTYTEWRKNGGTISLKTDISRSIPLFNSSDLNPFNWAFSGWGDFLATTKADIGS